MSDPKIYAPDQVVAIFGTHEIKGYADGTFIKVSRKEDSFTGKCGADGEVVRARNANKMGEVVFTLMQTSASNLWLATALAADELAPNGVSVFAFLMKDLLGFTLHQAKSAWIVKPADSEWAKEAGTREWKLECAKLSMLEGGNP